MAVRWLGVRSEEHTSELQSRQYLVCRLLLEKKKTDRHEPMAAPASFTVLGVDGLGPTAAHTPALQPPRARRRRAPPRRAASSFFFKEPGAPGTPPPPPGGRLPD